MISHSHKFLFIQIKKTATSSTHGALSRYMEFDYSKISRHAKYSEVAEFYPESKNYFKFSFVRNPWDRMLSTYFFKKGVARIKIDPNMSFKEFLSQYNHPDQYSYIEGFDNNFFIGRFENLQQDFDIVCDKIGIPQRKLPHANKSSHNYYTEYYDDESREIVARRYARDIEYFGYQFGN